MKKNILIFGGTGFIGFHLSLQCLKKKWNVTSVSSREPAASKRLKKVKYITCNISSINNIKKKIPKRNIDYVINLAGYVDHSNKFKVYKSHYEGCKNLANFFANKKIKSFIQMGSGLEYGDNYRLHKETFQCKPKSHYAKAKYLATKYLLKLYKIKNFPVTILRLYQAYGPYQDFNRLIPQAIINSLQNKKFNCTSGIQKRDFIYIDDLVKVIFTVLQNKKTSGEIINIGSGKRIEIRNLIKIIVKLCKAGRPNFGAIPMRKDESLTMCPDIKKSTKLLRFKNKFSIVKGLIKTIKSYQ